MTAENKGKATEAMLAQLHGALASQWLRKLKECPEELTPAELNTIRQLPQRQQHILRPGLRAPK